MLALHGKLRLDVLLPVLPWILAFCGNVVANKCTSGLTSLEAPICEVLTSANAGALVIPAAIPLLPRATKSEGPKGKRAVLKSKWGKRNVDKFRFDKAYEGSFNFVYPGDHWLAGINSFEAEGLEDVETSRRHENIRPQKFISAGPLNYHVSKRLLGDQGMPKVETDATKPSSGSDWIMYVATLLCGPVLFAFLACGMSTWLTRHAGNNSLATDDLANASNVDDDGMGFPVGLDVPSMHWANLFGALLRSNVLRNTNEGLSAKEIEKLPLVSHCEEDYQRTGNKLQCIICLNDVQDKEVLREITGCQHRFHPCCVDPWLERSATCPLCRRPVVIGDKQEDGGECTEEPQTMEAEPESSTSYSDSGDGIQQSDSESYAAEPPADSMPMQTGYLSVSELPNSFAARSIDTDSWSEASRGPDDDWELVENGT